MGDSASGHCVFCLDGIQWSRRHIQATVWACYEATNTWCFLVLSVVRQHNICKRVVIEASFYDYTEEEISHRVSADSIIPSPKMTEMIFTQIEEHGYRIVRQ